MPLNCTRPHTAAGTSTTRQSMVSLIVATVFVTAAAPAMPHTVHGAAAGRTPPNRAASSSSASQPCRLLCAESLLREYCDFSKEERCIGDAMIGAQLPLGLLSEGVAACAVTRRCAARLVLG